MKDAIGFMLREAWKTKRQPECDHPELVKEYSFSGTVTGYYLSPTCGQRMRTECAGRDQAVRESLMPEPVTIVQYSFVDTTSGIKARSSHGDEDHSDRG